MTPNHDLSRIADAVEAILAILRKVVPEIPPGVDPDTDVFALRPPLPVRARKCFRRLGIGTLGELVRRSAGELLESKNFGMTTLVEVQSRLGALGLHLRDESADVIRKFVRPAAD